MILKSIGDGHDLLTMTAWQLILGGLPLLVLAPLFGGGAGVS